MALRLSDAENDMKAPVSLVDSDEVRGADPGRAR